MGFAVPEVAVVVSSRRKFKTDARRWDDKLRENKLVVLAGKRVQAGSFHQNLPSKPFSREVKFVQTFLINYIEQLSVPTFCGSFWKSFSRSPSS